MSTLKLGAFNTESICRVSLGLVLMTVSWNYGFNAIALILFGLSIVACLIKNKKPSDNKHLTPLAKLIIAYGAINLISVVWSIDLETSIKGVPNKILFIFVPLAFWALERASIKNIQGTIVFFVAGILLTDTICLIKSCNHFYYYRDLDVFFYHRLSEQQGLNAIYLSLFNGIAFLTVFYGKWVSKLFKAILLLFFIVFLWLLQSKMIILGILTVLLVDLLIKSFVGRKSRLWILGMTLVLCSIGIWAIVKSDRFEEIKNSQVEKAMFENDLSNLDVDGISIRIVQYKALYQIFKEEPWRILTGFGLKAHQKKLNEQYEKFGLYTGENKNDGIIGLSFHNQYVYALLSCGVLGMIILFVSIFKGLYFNYLENRNILFGSLYLLFFLSFFSEMILERHRGAVCFLFLIFLFNKGNHKHENSNIGNSWNSKLPWGI
ncbi:O-antigen ligase family protein [Flagellimonas pelagia]|uniref:O-antigen ligase family protein n=1 Tax=Flagellimonas pelagia TaxID=2306998 RepID=A0A3A1NK38_9FLAO|nr:O-antigen ligase family protein [Allomuricauda maritima]RIV44606.1 hypothetical protein D2V05_09640 [Allomuricauda maritima]TXJ94671.1 O-antigen ligase family protein [Allomuricauda maritima]